MKKLKLNLQQLDGVEVLTRSQLKNVLGGLAIPMTSGGCSYGHLSCETDSDCAGINAGVCCGQSDGNNCCWGNCG